MSNSRSNDERKNPTHHVWWFIGLAIVCSIVAWFIMDKANARLESTHKTIIAHQQNSLTEIETFLDTYQAILSDTTTKLDRKTIEQLNTQLLNIAHESMENNGSERIGNLLESELSKIQSEYEVLNLWCALLTVVFLIFSFFSIFKANEMANQSEASLKDMRDIEKEVRQRAEEVDKQVNEAKSKINEITQSISSQNSQCEDLKRRINTLKDVEIAGLDTQIKTFEESMKKLPEYIETQKKDFETFFNGKLSEFSASVEDMGEEMKLKIEETAKVSFENQNDNFIKRMDKYEASLKNILNDIQELTTGAINEDDIAAAEEEEREDDGHDEDEMEIDNEGNNAGL